MKAQLLSQLVEDRRSERAVVLATNLDTGEQSLLYPLESDSEDEAARTALKKLDELGPLSSRQRTPAQKTVMGESARDHAARLIESGLLICEADEVEWHWNHLIAFSLLPTKRAQTKRNLFCGTAATNGQMANIETAVRAWVMEMGRPLGVEVTCTCLRESHLGLRLRYRLYDKKTGGLHSEYYNPLSPQSSAFDDVDAVYDRMCTRLAGA